MPEPCLLWPIEFAAPAPVVRVVTAGVERDATLAGITADDLLDWYVSEDDLIAELLDALNGLAGGVVWTASLSDDNVLTLDASGNVEILWTHPNTTLDPRIFGWTDADVGPAASLTAPNQTMGCWIPGAPGDPRDYREDTEDQRQIAVVITKTLDGDARGYDLSPEPHDRVISFYRIEAACASEHFASPTRPFGTFEQAWTLGGVAAARVFRLYDDRTDRGDYRTYKCTSGGRPWQLEEINGIRLYEIGPLELVEAT